MNFEGGYYVLPDLSIGAFINYHTNNEYISRQTLPISNSAALTTDQQHSVFQLPFGFATHYRFSDGACQPYIGLKLGANYTKMSSDFYIYEVKDNTWGFYVSPEVGVNIYLGQTVSASIWQHSTATLLTREPYLTMIWIN